MKTCKFFYVVEEILTVSGGLGFKRVSDFPTLAMARNFCTFNKGHYRITCSGYLEYKKGVEVK